MGGHMQLLSTSCHHSWGWQSPSSSTWPCLVCFPLWNATFLFFQQDSESVVGADLGKVLADQGGRRNVSLQSLPSCGAASTQPEGAGGTQKLPHPWQGMS